jgi:hypothetical protein
MRLSGLTPRRPVEEQEKAFNPFVPVRGKCVYWREKLNDEDRWDTRIKREDRHVECTCFVEGHVWTVTATTTPPDCPNATRCRYYVRAG